MNRNKTLLTYIPVPIIGKIVYTSHFTIYFAYLNSTNYYRCFHREFSFGILSLQCTQ